MGAVERVAIIGAGPSGAIAIDALIREKVFDVIKVFERQRGPGGCWYVCSFLYVSEFHHHTLRKKLKREYQFEIMIHMALHREIMLPKCPMKKSYSICIFFNSR